MKSKSKGTWIFAAVVAVVVGYAIYDYKSTESEKVLKEKQSLVLTTMADQIHIIRLDNTDSLSGSVKPIELEHDKEGWKLISPIQDRANSSVVDQFLEGLATERTIDTVVEGNKIDWSQFGLDHPLAKLSVTGNSGNTTVFSIGQRKNFQGDAYLRINDDKKVVTVSSTWFEKSKKTAFDFREKRWMRMSNATTEKISVEQSGVAFQLIKKDSNWMSPTHPDWILDQNKVRELLSMLTTTEALEFIAEGNAKPEELSRWGLSKPQTKLTLFLKDNKTWSVSIHQGSDKVHRIHTTEPDLVLKVSPTDANKFSQMSLESFRDRTVPFDFDKTKVQTLVYKSKEASAEVAASSDEGKKIMAQMRALKVEDFNPSAMGKWTQEIQLKDKSGEIVYRLQWSETPPSKKAKTPNPSNVPEIQGVSTLVKYQFTVSQSSLNAIVAGLTTAASPPKTSSDAVPTPASDSAAPEGKSK